VSRFAHKDAKYHRELIDPDNLVLPPPIWVLFESELIEGRFTQKLFRHLVCFSSVRIRPANLPVDWLECVSFPEFTETRRPFIATSCNWHSKRERAAFRRL